MQIFFHFIALCFLFYLLLYFLRYMIICFTFVVENVNLFDNRNISIDELGLGW